MDAPLLHLPYAKWDGSTEKFSLDEGLATLRKNRGILQELESVWNFNAATDTTSTLPLFEGEDIPPAHSRALLPVRNYSQAWAAKRKTSRSPASQLTVSYPSTRRIPPHY